MCIVRVLDVSPVGDIKMKISGVSSVMRILQLCSVR